MTNGTSRSLSDLRRAAQRSFEFSREAMLESMLLRVRFHHLYGAHARMLPAGPFPPLIPKAPPPIRLSPRELEVLQQVVQGKSTRQIAADLGIAFKTAACHRANLMAKLDVHETASLVRRAIELKLV